MRVVYVTHNGIGSAVVRSQVLPYLAGLRGRGIEIELVTFERDASPPCDAFPAEHWHPVRARSGHSLLAKAIDVAAGIATVVRIVRRTRADLIHARSYVPGAISLAAGMLVRRPFIFDMRGFLGEEYVDAGVWTAGDPRHRAVLAAESHLLGRAARIVVLTAAAARRLRTDPAYARHAARTPVDVIPCMVDLRRFHPPAERPAVPTLVYSGSLGMWYLLDEMLRVFAYARTALPELRFLILNRGDHDLIAGTVERLGIDTRGIDVRSVPFDDVPAELARASVGITLLREVRSKVGSSPIKIGEFLAAGLPVMVDAWTGDIGGEVRSYGAGHVVESLNDAALQAAAGALVGLVDDRVASARARRLAEEHYDLAIGVERYASAYAAVAGPRARATG